MATIRKAGREDARQLAQIAEQTFRDTFGAQNTEEDMEIHCRSTYGEAFQAIEICSPNMTTLLAEEGGATVGYAQLRWEAAPACVRGASPGQIQRLYVVKEWHGQGVAQALMQACLEEVRQRGSDVVWLGVWERNPRAISFYKKFGFTEVGDLVFPLGRDPQRDVVMARPVAKSLRP